MKMEIRSPLLSSKIARDAVSGSGLDDMSSVDAFIAIDKLGNLYDALNEAQKSVDPSETVEARAMRYEAQFVKAVERAKDFSGGAMERLAQTEKDIEARGVHLAGLSLEPKSGAEIRAALRAMSPAEREKSVMRAFEQRDSEVLASIYKSSTVTWGGTKAPVGDMFKGYIDTVSPETVRQRDAVATVMQSLELAVDSFVKSASGWRDAGAAERGRAQREHYERSGAALRDAIA